MEVMVQFPNGPTAFVARISTIKVLETKILERCGMATTGLSRSMNKFTLERGGRCFGTLTEWKKNVAQMRRGGWRGW